MPQAIRVAYLLTGDALQAEEIAQDAFVRVMGRFLHRRPPEAFGAYLRRSVINRAKDYHRGEKTSRLFALRAVEPSHQPEPPDPDDELQSLVLELPYTQRAALVLRYFEDLSEAESAATLGCSEGAIRSAAFRGIQTLRRKLGESDEV